MKMTHRCKLCKEEITNKHKHLFEKHQELLVKLFSYTFGTFSKPNMEGGNIKKVEGSDSIYEPDEEMYAAFERGSELGLKKMDILVNEYFVEL
jgi:hypothetical protein